ncbi:MAG: hypothetical protein ACP5MC_02955, partial [Candidatus Micrarchaeia archaeon]
MKEALPDTRIAKKGKGSKQSVVYFSAKEQKATKQKLLRKASAKAQSAMEYLMTYGWAILIIA